MESERQYDGSRFNHHVCSDFSFEDHNPPTIKMILAFCQHAETQLKEMADRTLVIHCKAGKVSIYHASMVKRTSYFRLCNARKDIANLQRVHILRNVASRDL